MRLSRSFQKAPGLFLSLICLSLLSGCGGGGSGSSSTDFSFSGGGGGDPTFYLKEVYFGRPLFDAGGNVFQVVNPRSIVEIDPITGIRLEGYPQVLYPGDNLGDLGSLNLEETPTSPYKAKIIPRDAALVLEFSQSVDPTCMNLDGGSFFTSSSPIRFETDGGSAVKAQGLVWGNQVIINPVYTGTLGMPPSPIIFDQKGAPKANEAGFLRLKVYSAGTSPNTVRSTKSNELAVRKDLLGSPVKPIGTNPGNRHLDFIATEISFNGFLPDLSAPRIIRDVNDTGSVGAGSSSTAIIDPSKNFVTAANNGFGEWKGALIILRPGTPFEEKAQVESNDAQTLYIKGGFVSSPAQGEGYKLVRAEFYEPIKDHTDLTTAVDPINRPKDPFDPEDLKNSDLFNFAFFDEYDDVAGVWNPVTTYTPGPEGYNPIHPKWRINFRFSEPMDADSFRPYESFFVCKASTSVEDPAFGDMKIGRVIGSDNNRILSFEPVLEEQKPVGTPIVYGDRLVGFGGQQKALRLVMRVVPPESMIKDFYDSLGPKANWPNGVFDNLDEEGVLGVINLGGQAIGLPQQFYNIGNKHCMLYTKSSGHGAFSPAIDLKYTFNTQSTSDPESGVTVHRFMGLPTPSGKTVGSKKVTGVIYNDHENELYGPRLIDIGIGLNGFISGHSVEYYEHVFDDFNHPPASTKDLIDATYPDPIFKIPFGVGTPITASNGCRFQHVYRRTDCCPDVPAFSGTVLDLTSLAWSPIGGWVTSTVIENMSIVVSHCHKRPNTRQSAGIPVNMGSGLNKLFLNNYGPSFSVHDQDQVVLGTESSGVPYVIDWKNLFKPQNAGEAFNNYLAWPIFDAPSENPGYPCTFNAVGSNIENLLIEYRMDPNSMGLAQNNGFSYHAGIMSSMLPRFRVYSRGNPNKLVFGASQPKTYTSAWGPLNAPGSYGDNSRYFMIFDYVKRKSTIESPLLKGEVGVNQDVVFMTPVVEPPLFDIPAGSILVMDFRNSMDSTGTQTSDWVPIENVEIDLNSGANAGYDYFQFRAYFEANEASATVPTIDTVVVPYIIK